MAKKKIRGEDGKEYTVKEKKPFYKKWWFWLIVVIVAIGALSGGDDDTPEVANEPETVEVEAKETEEVVEEEVVEEEVVEEEVVEKELTEITNEIVVGEPIELGDYSITIQGYSLGTDYDGKDVLIINYDWVNNSDDSGSPFITFTLKGFQDNVETDDVFMVDGVDLGIGQKEVRPGGQIEGAQDIVGIDDLSKPLELELDELFSFQDNAYTTVLDLTTIE